MASPPGVVVQISDIRAPAAAPTDTGVGFFVGLTDRGPLSPLHAGRDAIEINTLDDFEQTYGLRQSYSRTHDSLRAFFLEGGTRAYVARPVGPAAATATLNVMDGAGTPAVSLVVKANSPGQWANGATAGLGVKVIAGQAGGTYRLSIAENAVEVEQSYDLTTQQDAVDWATNKSNLVVVTIGVSSVIPVVTGSYANLTGGADDRANITTTQVQAALDGLSKTLGPGQVVAPDYTSDAVNAILLTHADANNRVALLSCSSTANAASLTASANAVEGGLTGRRGAIFAPWAKYPGPTPGSTIDLPWAVIEAGLIAKRDRLEGPNQPAAGEGGEAREVTGLTVTFTDTEHANLNNTGVNVTKVVYGRYRTYGYRTLADPVNDENWLQFSNTREIMYLAARAAEIGERFMFKEITRAGTLMHLEGDLIALCMEEFRRGALYPTNTTGQPDPRTAFFVDATSTTVNPDSELAKGNVRARVEVKVSPFAEHITIELVKVSITANLTGVNS